MHTAGARTSGFSCSISDLGDGCVRVDITNSGSDVIIPGTDVIAQLSYALDPTAPLGEYADLNPENIDIQDDTPEPLSVTPKPGRIQAVGTDSDGDSYPDYIDNCRDTPNAPALGTCLEIYYAGSLTVFKNTGITCHPLPPVWQRSTIISFTCDQY